MQHANMRTASGRGARYAAEGRTRVVLHTFKLAVKHMRKAATPSGAPTPPHAGHAAAGARTGGAALGGGRPGRTERALRDAVGEGVDLRVDVVQVEVGQLGDLEAGEADVQVGGAAVLLLGQHAGRAARRPGHQGQQHERAACRARAGSGWPAARRAAAGPCRGSGDPVLGRRFETGQLRSPPGHARRAPFPSVQLCWLPTGSTAWQQARLRHQSGGVRERTQA
jgi:hypothetical protein